MENIFEIVGYSKDYFLNGKYIGSLSYVEKDREYFGFYGRQTEILKEDIILNKNKKIKKDSVVVTELQKICGKKI